MSRSIKKGPFVAPELIKRVDELNKAGEKKVLKTWSRASMTAAVMCRCISRKTWSAISWASSFPPERSAATLAARPPILNEGGRKKHGS